MSSDNINMKTIKFLPNNKILLNKTKLLTKINYTNKHNSWYTIKGNNYIDINI